MGWGIVGQHWHPDVEVVENPLAENGGGRSDVVAIFSSHRRKDPSDPITFLDDALSQLPSES